MDYTAWQIIISITQNEVTINYVWGLPTIGGVNIDEHTFHIDQRQNQSGWEMIRPLLSQALYGCGLDISKLDLSAVAACHIWFDDEEDHVEKIPDKEFSGNFYNQFCKIELS